MAELFDPVQEESAPVAHPGGVPECASILDEVIAVVERAKSMPLSASAIISREEVLGLLDQLREALPVELVRARRLLREREELRAQAELEASELLDSARAQAAHLVQRTEVVRQARHHAERVVADAETEARRIRMEADDYVDRKLAAFEIVLDRTLRTVQAGREKLMALPEPEEPGLDPASGASGGPANGADEALFDQDEL